MAPDRVRARRADKGFDGIQLELAENGKSVTAVVIFEDKATTNARPTIRDEVWPGIEDLESGRRVAELTHDVASALEAHQRAIPELDVDEAVANILWKQARQYRVSITVDDTHKEPEDRKRLFKDYNQKAQGDLVRRRAETFYVPELRAWMDDFASRVIDHLEAVAHV